MEALKKQLQTCLESVDKNDQDDLNEQITHLLYLFWNSDNLQDSEEYDRFQQDIINIVVG